MRSRAKKYVESGEKSAGYFLGLENSRQSANCITCLRDTNGKSQVSDDEILNVAKGFYKQLYLSNASAGDNIDRYFETIPKEDLTQVMRYKISCMGCTMKVMHILVSLYYHIDVLPFTFALCIPHTSCVLCLSIIIMFWFRKGLGVALNVALPPPDIALSCFLCLIALYMALHETFQP